METLLKSYKDKEVASIIDSFKFTGTSHSFEHLKKVVNVLSDADSLKNVKELLKYLKVLKDNLPHEEINDSNIKGAQTVFSNINSHLHDIDGFFEYYENVVKGCTIEMNNEAKKIINELKEAKKILLYISDYVCLALDIYTEKKKKKKVYSLDELLSII